MKPAGSETMTGAVWRAASSGSMGGTLPAKSSRYPGRYGGEPVGATKEMKVRIGVGAGLQSVSGTELGGLAQDLEELHFDSLWMADLLSIAGDDPLTGLAY